MAKTSIYQRTAGCQSEAMLCDVLHRFLNSGSPHGTHLAPRIFTLSLADFQSIEGGLRDGKLDRFPDRFRPQKLSIGSQLPMAFLCVQEA